MGWDRDEARARKSAAHEVIGEVLSERTVPTAANLGGIQAASARQAAATVGIALGLQPHQDGSFGLAVRYQLGTPTARMLVRRVVEGLAEQGAAAEAIDVRRIGRIRALRPDSPPPHPVPTARAVGETDRVRPLRPGLSIANVAVTAGTLGGFVTLDGDSDGQPYLVSNHHVLVGDDGGVGDAIVQPGPYDGGSAPQDQIGTLHRYVPLRRGDTAIVDAALGALDDQEIDLAYPVGPLTGTAGVLGGEAVEKVGRTTGVTAGRISAIELDGVLVDFGPVFGVLAFDNQIEVESTGTGPFSQGGDSGSVVYRPDTRHAVGLLFAGSDRGGPNNLGLTFLNPIDVVLTELGATWLVADGNDDHGDGDGGELVPPLLSRDDARLLLRSVRGAVSGIEGITGVGLRRISAEDIGYSVVINVVSAEVIEQIPGEVREIAVIQVTGITRAL